MKKKIKLRFIIFFGALILFFLIAGSLLLFFLSPVHSANSELQQAYTITIPYGRSISQISQELKKAGLIRSFYVFYYYARIKSANIKAGRYTIKTAQSTPEIVSLFESGKQDYIRLAIPEGFTLSQIANLLERSEIISQEDFLLTARSKEILEKYAIPASSVEGYIFPDTYFLYPEMKAFDILTGFIDNFFAKLAELHIPTNNPAELHKLVILASIVEREYRKANEAPLMASVFANRIKSNIGLESCATVVYILTEIQKKTHPEYITYDDLKIDSPYNTYKWAGLPAGPISNPGTVAISAAAFPAKTDYYYFRLINPATGEHFFSSTLKDHVSAGKTIAAKKVAGF